MVRIMGNKQSQRPDRIPTGTVTTAAEKTPRAINPELAPIEKRRRAILLSKNSVIVASIVNSMTL